MTLPRLLVVLGIALVLLLAGLGAGCYWYFFGTNEFDSAELVPANTIFLASIPNAARIVDGYASSHAKTLAENPNSKPIHDAISNLVGTKNLDLLQAFLPNLSGQSFIAITHFDYDHPETVGLIAAMKPKPGLANFDAFIEKLKITWPEIRLGQTGTGSVDGVDYQWIRGPGAQDKICVAKIEGWIVVAWRETALQDFIERFRKQSTTSSLIQDVNYQKAIVPVGTDSMSLVYLNVHLAMEIARKEMAKSNASEADFLAKKFQAVGSAALGTKFDNGEIVDRFSLIIPRSVQLECGMDEAPCPFDTLKFTGPDTRLYWASSINWPQFYQHVKEQAKPSSYLHDTSYSVVGAWLSLVQNWVHEAGLDPKRNGVAALGPEISVQMEWPADESYPEAGLFVKLDKPDDFKPTIQAIIDTVRKTYATVGTVSESNTNGHAFATFQFLKTSAFSPTITKDGPYLGVFLTQNQATHCFQRDASLGLPHRAEFNAQIGDKRTTASQVLFLDSPYLLDRAYKTAAPYLSLAGMFDKNIGAFLKQYAMPDDLGWLAPMDTWSCVLTQDEEGVQAFSVSGIGNQGILIAAGINPTVSTLQSLGYLPKFSGNPPGILPPENAASSPPVAGVDTVPASIGKAPIASIIFITADSKIILDEITVPENQIGDVLKAKKTANPNWSLTVMVDRNALPEVLSTVMDAGASAGFGELSYAYSPKPLPPSTNSDSAIAPAPDAALPPATNASPETTGPIQPH